MFLHEKRRSTGFALIWCLLSKYLSISFQSGSSCSREYSFKFKTDFFPSSLVIGISGLKKSLESSFRPIIHLIKNLQKRYPFQSNQIAKNSDLPPDSLSSTLHTAPASKYTPLRVFTPCRYAAITFHALNI